MNTTEDVTHFLETDVELMRLLTSSYSLISIAYLYKKHLDRGLGACQLRLKLHALAFDPRLQFEEEWDEQGADQQGLNEV
ncbi:hypothetical protein ACW7EJ_01900, partial [Acinetobacter soli]